MKSIEMVCIRTEKIDEVEQGNKEDKENIQP